MKKLLLAVFLCTILVIPVNAEEIVAPPVPESGIGRMPAHTDSFPEAFMELMTNTLLAFHPELKEAVRICSVIIVVTMVLTFISILGGSTSETVSIAGTAAISAVMLQPTHSMVSLAADTVTEILEYGKLLCPVMTAALAAQGGITTSSALYAGTTVFITILGTVMSQFLVPMIYFFLAFALAGCAFGDEMLKKVTGLIKSLLTWLMKTSMVIFTTYLSITGVVSGTTDLAALKTAKVTISSVVPVVGGILSDSSEAVLVSMGIVKNTAGIYGILAVLTVFAGPFLKTGVYYMLLKLTEAVCAVFADKRLSTVTESFAAAMGFLAGLMAVGCVLVIISTICYLKGTG